jgi:hypothetical protein
MNAAINAQIIPFAARDDVHFVRELRNRAAHGAQPITLDEGSVALEKAKSVLAIIDRRDEDKQEAA